jgi:hypothetical protein
MVFWNKPHQINDAAGMRMESSIRWLVEACEKRGLPVMMNTGVEAYGFPTWIFNKYPEQAQRGMPQFSGNVYRISDPYMGGRGTPYWVAEEVYDVALASVKESIERFADFDCIVSQMEPHGELHHGDQAVLLEYGPVADEGYRRFLKTRYSDIRALSRAWYGEEIPGLTWEDVHVPELVKFAGWNEDSVDLQGEWSLKFEELVDPSMKMTNRNTNDRNYRRFIETKGTPQEWLQPDFDDSAWATVIAPGHDRAMFFPHQPAVYRRGFVMPAQTLKKSARWWLYVWDLNGATKATLSAHLNGTQVGESTITYAFPHWDAFEVSAALKPGKNVLALRLPQGFLGYRVYLSPVAPKQYPNLGENLNAQWADVMRFHQYGRGSQVRRGMQAIRQAAPDKTIELSAPDRYADAVLVEAKTYGGDFHNTGYMAGFYADYLSELMQGAGLPMTAEPGGPAKDVAKFRAYMGRYLTEGVNGVDYFIHAGDVLWNPDIRQDFEDNLDVYHLFGKYHAEQADVGILFSTLARRLTEFPWQGDPNIVLRSGYFPWNISSPLLGVYPFDFLSDSSFDLGDAAKYRIIIDSNTSIMDDGLREDIERWVRAGGVFVTSGQTGRHTTSTFNGWPIGSLSGYQTVRLDAYDKDGKVLDWHFLKAAAGQEIYGESWNGVRSQGLGLKPVADDCQDLLLWEDGTTAVGMRKLGKGMVIQVGANFAGTNLPQRVMSEAIPGEVARMRELYGALLTWLKVEGTRIQTDSPQVYGRHYVSNNGLYDVWVVWNTQNKPLTSKVTLKGGQPAEWQMDIADKTRMELENQDGQAVIPALELIPFQPRAFLSPRRQIQSAAEVWFGLQRNWWQGGDGDLGKPFPEVASLWPYVRNFSDNWAFKPVATDAEAASLVGPDADTEGWERRDLGIWSGDHPTVDRAIFRREFEVPDDWHDGTVKLWLRAWAGGKTLSKHADIYLDGKRIDRKSKYGISGKVLKEAVAGSRHVLALDIRGEGVSDRGSYSEAWLSYLPRPAASQDLAGTWQMSGDTLRFERDVSLPGDWDGWQARRTALIPENHRRDQVLLRCDGSAQVTGVIINGRWIRQDHHQISQEWLINITQWVKFGEENEIILGRLNDAGKGNVRAVSLDYYGPGSMFP